MPTRKSPGILKTYARRDGASEQPKIVVLLYDYKLGKLGGPDLKAQVHED